MKRYCSVPISLLTLGTISVGILGTTFNRPARAATLVTCGPNGAAYIVKIVPAGCRVLAANSPPKQAGNAVEGSRLNFYHKAANPSNPRASTQLAAQFLK